MTAHLEAYPYLAASLLLLGLLGVGLPVRGGFGVRPS